MSNRNQNDCQVCGGPLYEVYEDGCGDHGDGICVSYKCEECHTHFEAWELAEDDNEYSEGEFE